MATDHDDQRHNLVKFVPMMLWIWRFLKSTPLVFHVFIAVAVMVFLVAIMVVAIIVCGHHGIGPQYDGPCILVVSKPVFVSVSILRCSSKYMFVCECACVYWYAMWFVCYSWLINYGSIARTSMNSVSMTSPTLRPNSSLSGNSWGSLRKHLRFVQFTYLSKCFQLLVLLLCMHLFELSKTKDIGAVQTGLYKQCGIFCNIEIPVSMGCDKSQLCFSVEL